MRFLAVMAEAFKEALKWVEAMKAANMPYVIIQDRLPEFKQGDFVVNRAYELDPPLLGMLAPKQLIHFDKPTLNRIRSFARERGLKVVPSGLNVYLKDREGRTVGWLRLNYWGATSPELFEEIGREIYGIGTKEAPKLVPPKPLPVIIRDLVLGPLFVIAFFLLFPLTMIAYSLFLTDFPNPLFIGVGVALMVLAFYMFALYVKENLAQESSRPTRR